MPAKTFYRSFFIYKLFAAIAEGARRRVISGQQSVTSIQHNAANFLKMAK